jgi:hypothetical protein
MQKRTNLTPSKGQLAPMLIARVDTLATVRANGLALLAWLACTLWFPAFGIYAGQRMEAVVDWITILGVILGFAAGWLVGWRLKPQGAFPVWISLYFSMGWLGNIMR